MISYLTHCVEGKEFSFLCQKQSKYFANRTHLPHFNLLHKNLHILMWTPISPAAQQNQPIARPKCELRIHTPPFIFALREIQPTMKYEGCISVVEWITVQKSLGWSWVEPSLYSITAKAASLAQPHTNKGLILHCSQAVLHCQEDTLAGFKLAEGEISALQTSVCCRHDVTHCTKFIVRFVWK